MANEQPQQGQQINLAMSENALFADGFGTAIRIKAIKNAKGDAEKEGMIEVLFLDSIRQKVVTSVVVSKLTVKDMIGNLTQTLANLEKEMASKEMPKTPQIKTTSNPPTGIR